MKIIIAGDIHIGRRSSAIEESQDCISTKYTWNRMVEYAIEHRADLMVLTGDIIDRDNRYFEAITPLQTGLQRLGQQGISVCMVAGNHDYDVLPDVIRQLGLNHVVLLGGQEGWTETVFEKDGEALQLIGWSFPSLHYENDPVSELPTGLIRENMPTIALVHGDAWMQKTNYAPLHLPSMKAMKQVDAWLLGHVHKPQVIAEDPLILYPGSPHALSPKETGIHGPYWLELEGRTLKKYPLALSPVRYELLSIDVSDITDKDHFREKMLTCLREHTESLMSVDELKYLIYDIELTGVYDHPAELKLWSEELKDYNGNHAFREKIRTVDFKVDLRVRTEAFLNDPSYMGVLANAIDALYNGKPNSFVDQLRTQWKEKYHLMIHSSTYNPLLLKKEEQELNRQADEFILRECRRLFMELYSQRKHAD